MVAQTEGQRNPKPSNFGSPAMRPSGYRSRHCLSLSHEPAATRRTPPASAAGFL